MCFLGETYFLQLNQMIEQSRNLNRMDEKAVDDAPPGGAVAITPRAMATTRSSQTSLSPSHIGIVGPGCYLEWRHIMSRSPVMSPLQPATVTRMRED